jgi:Fic family protein
MMKQLMGFHKDILDGKTGLHTVLAATKLSTTFFHIHPFFHDNGRMRRLLMAFTLLRLGYHPVVYQQIGRAEYVEAVFQAQQGHPEELYYITLEELENYYMCL